MSDRSRQWELPTVLFFGSNRPDSRVVNWYHGPQRRLMGKIPKSFNKHYDTASPAQGSSGEDAALVREEGSSEPGALRPQRWGEAVCPALLQGHCRDHFPRVDLCPSFFHGE